MVSRRQSGSGRPRGLGDLPTPAAVVDTAKLDRNIDAMEQRARSLGVKLRPHLKTTKSKAIAERIPSARAHGATVSTVTEAEHFADGPPRSLLYARIATAADFPRIEALYRRGVEPILAVDAIEVVTPLHEFAWRRGTQLRVAIEIDSGEHRSGIAPDDPMLPVLIELLDGLETSRLEGVFTHGGHSYEARSSEEIAGIAEAERTAVLSVASLFEERGVPCPLRSVGSTPTAVHARHLEGCTELRAGVYVFQDLFQHGLGACAIDDIALSVLTTVIGHRPKEGRLLVDAGGLALSKDRSTQALGEHEGQVGDCGYGLVQDLDGLHLEYLMVTEAWQEHGVIEARPGYSLDVRDFPRGTKLRILPNHACMTAAAYDGYTAVEPNGALDWWPRVNGWRPVGSAKG